MVTTHELSNFHPSYFPAKVCALQSILTGTIVSWLIVYAYNYKQLHSYMQTYACMYAQINIHMQTNTYTHQCIHIRMFYQGLLQNAKRQKDGHHSGRFDETKDSMFCIVIHTDTTFNLITEDWCQASMSCRNSRRVRGKQTGEAMPICYLLSRTETGAGVAHMFVDVRKFLQLYEDFPFYWNVVVSDHHDGVISALSAIKQGAYCACYASQLNVACTTSLYQF